MCAAIVLILSKSSSNKGEAIYSLKQTIAPEDQRPPLESIDLGRGSVIFALLQNFFRALTAKKRVLLLQNHAELQRWFLDIHRQLQKEQRRAEPRHCFTSIKDIFQPQVNWQSDNSGIKVFMEDRSKSDAKYFNVSFTSGAWWASVNLAKMGKYLRLGKAYGIAYGTTLTLMSAGVLSALFANPGVAPFHELVSLAIALSVFAGLVDLVVVLLVVFRCVNKNVPILDKASIAEFGSPLAGLTESPRSPEEKGKNTVQAIT